MADFTFKGDTLVGTNFPRQPIRPYILRATTDNKSIKQLLIGDSVAYTSRGRTVIELGRAPEEAYVDEVRLPTQRGWKIPALEREDFSYSVINITPAGPGVAQVDGFDIPYDDLSIGNEIVVTINGNDYVYIFNGEDNTDVLSNMIGFLDSIPELTGTFALIITGNILSFTITAAAENTPLTITVKRTSVTSAALSEREDYMLVFRFPWTPRLALPGTPARTVGLNSTTPDECGWLSCWTWARNLETSIVVYNVPKTDGTLMDWEPVSGVDYTFAERVCILPPETEIDQYIEISIFYRIGTYPSDGALNGINVWEPHLTATKTP